MADLEAVKFVESYKLERFITDGLNSGKFGHGAVEILSEIYVLERYDVAPVVHGRWDEKQIVLEWCEDDVDIFYTCSACGAASPSETFYCPNCGARMDGVENG